MVFFKDYALCVLECFLGFDGESVESDGHVCYLLEVLLAVEGLKGCFIPKDFSHAVTTHLSWMNKIFHLMK